MTKVFLYLDLTLKSFAGVRVILVKNALGCISSTAPLSVEGISRAVWPFLLEGV
jgi:hypothetical protein